MEDNLTQMPVVPARRTISVKDIILGAAVVMLGLVTIVALVFNRGDVGAFNKAQQGQISALEERVKATENQVAGIVNFLNEVIKSQQAQPPQPPK